jgi:cyclopropane-fatty-acyl-phospholipid synthase
MEPGIMLAENGWLPDFIIQIAIRRLIRQRLADAEKEAKSGQQAAFISSLYSSPIAIANRESREQHYEEPTDFFRYSLGPRMKYSCCYYPDKNYSLAAAEEEMLKLTCERAEFGSGMSILELGCGWGALTLWLAEQYPNSTITAVSNSSTQRICIENLCREKGITNIRVVTSDMNEFQSAARFDRIVSVEMFEHMRNYPELLRRIADWLNPEGKLFVHIFCHKCFTYPFVAEGKGNWMARHFFTGGIMPAFGLLCGFNEHLEEEMSWKVNGMHYYRTCMDWLACLDDHRDEAQEILQRSDIRTNVFRYIQRWRMFFLASAELFAYNQGNEWFVGHYRFKKK